MAGTLVKILDGLGDQPLNDNQANNTMGWIGHLVGDSLDDNDEEFQTVSVGYVILFLTPRGLFISNTFEGRVRDRDEGPI